MAAVTARVATRRLVNSLFVAFCIAVTGVALLALAAILFTLVKNGAGMEVVRRGTKRGSRAPSTPSVTSASRPTGTCKKPAPTPMASVAPIFSRTRPPMFRRTPFPSGGASLGPGFGDALIRIHPERIISFGIDSEFTSPRDLVVNSRNVN